MADPVRFCVLGAPGDTSNLGVTALLESTLIGLRTEVPECELVVFDNGTGQRRGECRSLAGTIGYERLGIRRSRRVYLPESMAQMALAARVRVLRNRGLERMRAADAILDISGGDSFSDIYGQRRFETMSRQKSLALMTGTPLMLLPQTYGPYLSPSNARSAADLVARSTYAWARDDDSLEVLRQLLGTDFDERRHQVSVDVAFGLPRRRPAHLPVEAERWLIDSSLTFGVNVSGLLSNDATSHRTFGLSTAYDQLMTRVLERILTESDAKILFVPHVHAQPDQVESDIAACRRLENRLLSRYPDRVMTLDGVDQAQEIKWVIARCAAFVGTRMHSTIAALSSCVPTLALAYSPKTAGVFASCGQRQRVVDLRSADVGDVANAALALWEGRETVRVGLESRIPGVIDRSRTPFRTLADDVASRRDSAAR